MGNGLGEGWKNGGSEGMEGWKEGAEGWKAGGIEGWKEGADEGFDISFHRASSARMKSPMDVELVDNPINYVKSSNIPYIEEEKNILNNINVVDQVKRKFLQS